MSRNHFKKQPAYQPVSHYFAGIVYVSLMLLEIDLLTLFMGVGLKLPSFINPLCGQMGRSCPDVFKKV